MTHVYANDPRGQWMGELPEGWESVRLPNVIYSYNRGKIITAEFCNKGDFLLYKSGLTPILTNFPDFPNEIKTGSTDLLLGTVGNPYVIRPLENSMYGHWMYRLLVRDNIRRDYLYYALLSASKNIIANGVTLANINFTSWSQLVFPLPPKDVQEKIAGYLDREVSLMDHQMDAIKQSIPLLEKRRESVIFHAVTGRYKDLLVGEVGDDVNAYAGDPRADWMGELPQGWRATRLPLVIDGKNRGIQIDRSVCVTGDDLFYTCARYPFRFDFSRNNFPKNIYTKSNDLLLNSMIVPYVHFPLLNSVYSHHVYRVKISNNYNTSYIGYALMCASKYINGQGVAIDSLNFQRWSQLVFPLPNRETQQAIADYLDAECGKIDRTIDLYRQMYDVLKQRRESLIYEAVTGKLAIQ